MREPDKEQEVKKERANKSENRGKKTAGEENRNPDDRGVLPQQAWNGEKYALSGMSEAGRLCLS